MLLSWRQKHHKVTKRVLMICPLSLRLMALRCALALLTTKTGHSGGPSYECAKRLSGAYFVVFGTAGPDIRRLAPGARLSLRALSTVHLSAHPVGHLIFPRSGTLTLDELWLP